MPRLSKRWESPRSRFGDFAVLAFLVVQCLDGIFTYLGVTIWGPGIEANPIVRQRYPIIKGKTRTENNGHCGYTVTEPDVDPVHTSNVQSTALWGAGLYAGGFGDFTTSAIGTVGATPPSALGSSGFSSGGGFSGGGGGGGGGGSW